MKIAVAPTVLVMEALFYGKRPKPRIVASVGVVCLGVGVATVTGAQIVLWAFCYAGCLEDWVVCPHLR
jgi:solute carrier family 35 protein E3